MTRGECMEAGLWYVWYGPVHDSDLVEDLP